MEPLANDLIMYARAGKLDQLSSALREISDIDALGRNGWTALLHACAVRKAESAKILLDSGSNVNWSAEDKTTALITATWANSPECVQLLLERGADPHATDKEGLNAHQIAVKHRRHKAEQILAKAVGYAVEPKQIEPIAYDIDKLLASEDFLIDVHNALYKAIEDRNPDLLGEEIQLFAIAALHVDSGNGFETIIQDENYEVILDALEARSVVQDTLLDRALGDTHAILNRYKIPRSPEGWQIHYATLENTGRLKNFEDEIEELDRRYFYGRPSLWHNCDEYIEKARQYAGAKRNILAIRKDESARRNNQ